METRESEPLASPHPDPPWKRLRRLASGAAGWTPRGARASRLEVGGGRLTVRPVAARGSLCLLVCEPAPGTALPGRRARLAIRRRLARRRPPVVAFVDGAGLWAVWTWSRPARWGVRAERERVLPLDAAAPDVTELLRLAAGEQRRDLSTRAGEPPTTAARELHRTLLRVVRPSAARTMHPPRVLQRFVEAAGPKEARAVWRALLRLRATDADVGDGAWLLDARDALEMVYLACLDRMRSIVEESGALESGHRSDALADVHLLVQRAGERPGAFARELILLHNLSGRGASRRGAGRCRRLLRGGLPPGFPCDVGWGPAAEPPLPGDEDARAIAAAARLLRALHLRYPVPPSELAAGYALLRARAESRAR